MSEQNTKTRAGGKAPSAGQGAPDTQPSAQQVKDDSPEVNPVIDPETAGGSGDSPEPIVKDHIDDNSGGSGTQAPGDSSAGGSGDSPEPIVKDHIDDNSGGSGTQAPGDSSAGGSGDSPEPIVKEHNGDNDIDTAGEPIASQPILPVIAVAYEGTADLVRRLWEKFLPEGVPVNVGIVASMEEMLSHIISSPAIPEEFIFVPANCVPVASVDLADLSQIKVYVRKDGVRSFEEPLPMLLNKDRLIECLAAETGLAGDDFFGKYMKAHHPDIRPMEVSHHFGNFVTLVMRNNPCENVVIGGMCQRKFISASSEGWRAIEHLLNKRLE